MSDNKSAPVFNNRHLRFVFVAFLFSAAIGEVGRGAVKVYGHESFFLPAATHLAVAFVAISMSWVYWARNILDGPQLKDIFSREYLLLVLDLLLVFIYIGVAQSAELPSPDPGAELPVPSAVPESQLLAAVYFIYFIWDLVNDVWTRNADTEVPSHPLASLPRPRARDTLKAAMVRSAASLVCCLFAVAIVATARARNIHSNLGVCLLNLAELGNLFLFRSLKSIEYRFDHALHAVYQEKADRYADVRGKMHVSAFLASTIYGFALTWVLAAS